MPGEHELLRQQLEDVKVTWDAERVERESERAERESERAELESERAGGKAADAAEKEAIDARSEPAMQQPCLLYTSPSPRDRG